MANARSEKVYASAAAAVADIPSGASIAIGGFAPPHSWPSSLVFALRDRPVKDLTIIGNTIGFGPFSPHVLADNHQVSKLIASSGALPMRHLGIADQIASGEVVFEAVP